MHDKCVEAERELYPEKPVKQLSDTKSVCSLVSCQNIRDCLDAL